MALTSQGPRLTSWSASYHFFDSLSPVIRREGVRVQDSVFLAVGVADIPTVNASLFGGGRFEQVLERANMSTNTEPTQNIAHFSGREPAVPRQSVELP